MGLIKYSDIQGASMNTENTETIMLSELNPAHEAHENESNFNGLTNLEFVILCSTAPIDNIPTTIWRFMSMGHVVEKKYEKSGNNLVVSIRTANVAGIPPPDTERVIVPLPLAVSTMNFRDTILNGHGSQNILRKLFTYKPGDIWESQVQALKGEPFHFPLTMDKKAFHIAARNTDHAVNVGGTIHSKTYARQSDGSYTVTFIVGANTHSCPGITSRELLLSSTKGDIIIDKYNYKVHEKWVEPLLSGGNYKVDLVLFIS